MQADGACGLVTRGWPVPTIARRRGGWAAALLVVAVGCTGEILAGTAGGRLRGDEHHAFPGENLSKTLLTIAQTMGTGATEMGMDAGWVDAPLPGIQA